MLLFSRLQSRYSREEVQKWKEIFKAAVSHIDSIDSEAFS